MFIKILLLSLISISTFGEYCKPKRPSLRAEVAGLISSTQFSPIARRASSEDAFKWNLLKQENHCKEGRMDDLSFTVKGNNPGNQMNGLLRKGYKPGKVLSTAFGKTPSGDLVFFQQVRTSSGDIANNIIVSYCMYDDGYGQVIGPDGGMDDFYVSDFVLGTCNTATKQEDCREKILLGGQIGFFSPAYGDYYPMQFAKY